MLSSRDSTASITIIVSISHTALKELCRSHVLETLGRKQETLLSEESNTRRRVPPSAGPSCYFQFFKQEQVEHRLSLQVQLARQVCSSASILLSATSCMGYCKPKKVKTS